jgi:4-carboxymuconolactone decarboxylase
VPLGVVLSANPRPDELPAQLRRAIDNGVTREEISAPSSPHISFYGGFPAAISASVIANEELS